MRKGLVTYRTYSEVLPFGVDTLAGDKPGISQDGSNPMSSSTTYGCRWYKSTPSCPWPLCSILPTFPLSPLLNAFTIPPAVDPISFPRCALASSRTHIGNLFFVSKSPSRRPLHLLLVDVPYTLAGPSVSGGTCP